METQTTLNRVADLLSHLVRQIEHENAAGLLDINRLAEDILLAVFREVYGYSSLVNLNQRFSNYPSIDLGDSVARVAFQITSDSSSAKITDTLKSFVHHECYKQYSHLVVYIITQKQRAYRGTTWPGIIEDRFGFDKSSDIRDSTDLMQVISHLPPDRMRHIEALLSSYLESPSIQIVPKLLDEQVDRQLQKEKQTRRYIPNIYVEVSDVKDQARFLAYPAFFLPKILDEAARLALPDVNAVLRKLGLAQVGIPNIEQLLMDISAENLHCSIAVIRASLQKILAQLAPYSFPYREGPGFDEALIARDSKHLYPDMRFRLGAATANVVYPTERLLERLDLFASRVLILVARAGRGKTNFVCDFAENVLRKRGIPCVYLTGRELRYISANELGQFFTRTVFNDDSISLKAGLRSLDRYAAHLGKPVLIIIDGINEHKDIPSFSYHLERFIEQALEWPNIRFVLTCRSEYFEQRFRNLRMASFGTKSRVILDMDREMTESHRSDLLTGYFHFFRIRCPYLSSEVRETLEADPLLLRMFCEVHGDPGATTPATLPQITSIHRAKLFGEYYERKIGDAYDRTTGSGLGLDQQGRIRAALTALVRTAIETDQFRDIAVSDLPVEYHEALYLLLDEDVFVRRDLSSPGDPFSEPQDVVNFTFDEFRDYLVARYLVGSVFGRDPGEFDRIADRILVTDSSAAEGVGIYLFFAAREPNRGALAAAIQSKDWYESAFMRGIFSVEDEYVTPGDLEVIRRCFLASAQYSSWIIRMLVYRWRASSFPKLSIRFLFEILDSLDESEYDKCVRPALGNPGMLGFDGMRTFTVRELTDELNQDIDHLDPSDVGEFANLMELLIYLFPIRDNQSLRSEAFNAFARFADRCPETAVCLLRKHTNAPHQVIRTFVSRALGWRNLAC